jgi:hypothetical protein
MTRLPPGGALEHALEVAAHETSQPTKRYDRTKERLMQAESPRGSGSERTLTARGIFQMTTPYIQVRRFHPRAKQGQRWR